MDEKQVLSDINDIACKLLDSGWIEHEHCYKAAIEIYKITESQIMFDIFINTIKDKIIPSTDSNYDSNYE